MLKHLLRGGGSDLDGNSWIATLGGGRIEDGQSVAVGPDGSVYVGGSTSSLGKGYQVALLAKFNSSGALQWQKILLGDNFSGITSVAVGPDGFVYVCGAFRLAGKDVNNCLIAKFNSSGTLQWQKMLSTSVHAVFNSVAVGQDGSVYAGGEVDSNRNTCLVAKFNSSGTLQWQKTFGGNNYDYLHAVAVGPDGYIYVGGASSSHGGSGYAGALLTKFNSSGTMQWQKILGIGASADFYSLAFGSDGSVYACGEIVPGEYYRDILLAKFNPSGALQWQKTLYKYDYDYSYGIAVGPDDSVYIGGRMSSATGQDIPDAVIAMFNASGTLRWQKTINYSGFLYIRSVAVGQDDSVYACGRAEVRGDLISPIWLIKVKDDIIAQSSSVYGEYTIENASFNNTNVSYGVSTLSLSLATSSLSVSTSSLTVEDINFTFNKYTGD